MHFPLSSNEMEENIFPINQFGQMETNLIFCTECIEILEGVTLTTVKAEKKKN